MKYILLICTLMMLSGQTKACLNGASTELKDGTLLYENDDDPVPSGHIFRSDDNYIRGLARLDTLYRSTKNPVYQSDKGLLLILLKRYDEAIRLFLDLERTNPGLYQTAANLGTAYELTGQNDKALQWISKAVAINPDSHEHSEWIHVNILKAKIAGEAAYTSAFLLGMDFGTQPLPQSQMNAEQLRHLSRELYYQLNERISFVKPKEKIVARLLFDLGNIEALRGDEGVALGDYNLAKQYGFSDPLIEQRIAALSAAPKQTAAPTVKPAPSLQTSVRYGIVLGAIVVLGAIIIVTYRRSNRS